VQASIAELAANFLPVIVVDGVFWFASCHWKDSAPKKWTDSKPEKAPGGSTLYPKELVLSNDRLFWKPAFSELLLTAPIS